MHCGSKALAVEALKPAALHEQLDGGLIAEAVLGVDVELVAKRHSSDNDSAKQEQAEPNN